MYVHIVCTFTQIIQSASLVPRWLGYEANHQHKYVNVCKPVLELVEIQLSVNL